MVFRFLRALVIGLVPLAAVWYVISSEVGGAVDRVVRHQALDKAEHWGAYMANQIPNLDQLVLSGIPDDDQKTVIRDIRQIGDIFRFKLFSPEGRLVLVSDDSNIAAPTGIAEQVDPEANRVIATGKPIVEVHNGEHKANRPDLYAEAYIPLFAPSGALRAVVEVYVDQSMTRAYFGDSFRSFGIVMALFCAVIFTVPGVAFYLQRILAKRSQKNAEYLANYDSLTGLLNRRAFVAKSEEMIADGSLSLVCYLDLDRFKSINDTYGHAAGDAFLVHIAEVLRNCCRSEDLLARFGGDEFVIAFQDISMEAAVVRARRILKDCASEVDIGALRLSASVSIGLAVLSEEEGLEQTLSNADAALYHAKQAGRNDYAIYGQAMGDELRRRRALEIRLREATANQEFEVHYQPLVDREGQKIVGYEALLRLNDTDGVPISPAEFVPIAEDLGLIEEIGDWTIQTAISQIATVAGDATLAINLSPAQYRSGNLVDTVREALEAADFPAKRLELEVTESLLLDDSMMIEMQIDGLQEMGVSIAMDDFGTGFSSLSYLWKYGFDRLKIDRSFVAALEHNPERSREVIETVVLLGARLGMKVTAEGVETEAQSNLLAELGCDTLQGYLFGEAEHLNQLQTTIHPGAGQHNSSRG